MVGYLWTAVLGRFSVFEPLLCDADDFFGREMEDFIIDGEKSPVAFEFKSSVFVCGRSYSCRSCSVVL